MTYPSNALLAQNPSYIENRPSSLCLANDNVRAYSSVPTAHVRDMVADGITGNGIAIYMAIADRQVDSEGEYFRSNDSLALETGLKVSTVRKWLAVLKKAGYLSIWTKNGGRRMRVCTKVCYPDSSQLLPSEQKSATQIAPYKENKIKTTKQRDVDVSFSDFSLENSPFRENTISQLVDRHGKDAVRGGLLVWESIDKEKIRCPDAWLAMAIKKNWKPSKKNTKAAKFPESPHDHDRIIAAYIKENGKDKCRELSRSGLDRNRIAYKIWSKKI